MTGFTSHMQAALEEARAAAARGETPVGAVIVQPGGKIIAAAGNRTRELNDPSAHAEILAIRAACATLGSERLPGLDLYVTLEPCAMCAAAISFARISRLYYGATDPKGGAVASGPRFFSQATCHHKPEIYDGVAETESATLLRRFFRERRGKSVSAQSGIAPSRAARHEREP
ncbi:nucleoside deaminase [Pikeienuella piscinae]|uniref:tRNA-specific adenosine deaminase n=1 Tax=Pikeienuella piscinae TaxID=2748098 RepID=A0A7L5BW38_9RHOB|nr:nucleoside deaminase [Pikeienuella piscinae]QIE54094.1 nucleoside deaminase [Pikeienuella piscinae]